MRRPGGVQSVSSLRRRRRPDRRTTVSQRSDNSRADNSYDFVRFCAASAVLFSHHFDLVGRPEPQVPGLGWDFGEFGIAVFFCLSGFLICRSLQRSNDWAAFAAARILRIFPNLAFVLAATSLVTLAWYRNASHLIDHIDYVAGNLAMFVRGVSMVIPGVFIDALRTTVNEPLWTLPYELWMYVALFALFLAGARRSGAAVIAATAGFALFWSLSPWFGEVDIGPLESRDLLRLGTCFLAGASLAVLWPALGRRPLALGGGGLAALVLLNLVPADMVARPLIVACALAACVIGLGQARTMRWFSRGGDASYGIYVFAWPVQQFSLLLIGSFWLSLATAFAVTVAIGYATWHGFERRAMAHRGAFAEWIRSPLRLRRASGVRPR